MGRQTRASEQDFKIIKNMEGLTPEYGHGAIGLEQG